MINACEARRVDALHGGDFLKHYTSVREKDEGAAQAHCSCGWESPVFGRDKKTGTMDALQEAKDAADLHEWDASLE